jgi:basic amino acid/polyamine antiporter, APA family
MDSRRVSTITEVPLDVTPAAGPGCRSPISEVPVSGLQRRLVRVDALAIALGSVIGVGVFRNTGLSLLGTGGILEATLLWIGVGLVCANGAILYADLSTRVPEAGGPYAYVRVAFGRPAAFIYGWMNGGIAMPVRQASVVAVIGELLSHWLPFDQRPIAIAVLLLLLAIHLLGIRVGAIAQRIFTTGKLATLALVIGLSAVLIASGGPEAASTAAMPAAIPFATAVAAVWYTYLGWQDVVLLAEELREPRKDLPIVLIGTVLLVLVLYTTVQLVVYLALDGGAAAFGAMPAIGVGTAVLGAVGTSVFTALTLSSMTGGAAESMMVRPRIAMALGRDGLGPRQLAAIDKNGTPYGAMIFHSAVALFLVSTGSFTDLLPLLAFAQGFLGIFETASYFKVIKKRPELPLSRFHPWSPLIFIAANIALCGLSLRNDPARAGMALGVIAVLGVVGLIVLRGKAPPDEPKPPELARARVIRENHDS